MLSAKFSVILCLTVLSSAFFAASSATAASSSFGTVTVGDSSSVTFGGVYVCNFTSPADLSTIRQVSVYLATGGTSAKAVIYSDKNGAPDALLAQSAEVSIDGTNGTWVNFDISYAGSPNTSYWLGVVFQSAGTYFYASGVSGKAIYSSAAVEAPAKLTDANVSANESLSIYAAYTPAGATSASPAPFSSGLPQMALLAIAVVGVIIALVVVAVFVRNKQKVKQNQ